LLFQTSLGIYIEDDKLSIVYLKASFKGVQLAGQSIFSLDKEKPINERLDTISALAREFMRENRIPSTNIHIGIKRDLAIIRFVELPLAVKDNLRETLGYEMEKYVPFSMDDVYFDFQIAGEDKENNKLAIVLVAMRKDALSPYIELKDRLGSKGIYGIEINSTAAVNYFSQRFYSACQDGLLLVNMNVNDLEVNLIKSRSLTYSRFLKIPENGSDINGLISEELKKVKDIYGPMHVSFLGPDSHIDNFRNSIRDLELEEFSIDLSKTGISTCDLIPAYGLALKGIQKVPVDINLLPADIRKKASRAGLYAMYTLLGLLVLSGLSWGLGDIVRQRMAFDDLNKQIKTLSADIEKIDRIKAECKSLEDQIEYLNRLGPGSLSALDVLKELSERIPENAWLRKFSLTEDKVEIEGNAGSASDLISLIEACPLFKDAVFLSPITKLRDGKEFFRIGFKLIKIPAE